MNKMKRTFFLIITLLIVSITCIPLCGCFGIVKEKTRMVMKSENVIKVIITDCRDSLKKTVTIEDAPTIKIIKDRFYAISGTKMKRKIVVNSFPTRYEEDFPSPIFILELTVLDEEQFEYNCTIYGGRKEAVYEQGYSMGTPTYYDYDYRYVCKKNYQTGHYENETEGPEKEFYLQFLTKNQI